jgi:SAM-dependent methyltransferase
MQEARIVCVSRRRGPALAAHLIVAIARNQLTRVGVVPLVKAALGRKNRGGNPWSERPLELGVRHVREQYELLSPELPADLAGKAGLEIGPGDSTALAGCFAMRGAEMYAIERFGSVDAEYTDRLIGRLGAFGPSADGGVRLSTGLFEDFWPPRDLDFIYSMEVMSLVSSPREVFAHALRLLKPGGRMVHSIDLSGHQIGDLEHLCCPDWLWELAYSHVVTTNRVRMNEFVDAAKEAGFSRVEATVQRWADVSAIRPHVLERWRQLPDRELGALQVLLTAEK